MKERKGLEGKSGRTDARKEGKWLEKSKTKMKSKRGGGKRVAGKEAAIKKKEKRD